MDPSTKLQISFQKDISGWLQGWLSRESPGWLTCGPEKVRTAWRGVSWERHTEQGAALGHRALSTYPASPATVLAPLQTSHDPARCNSPILQQWYLGPGRRPHRHIARENHKRVSTLPLGQLASVMGMLSAHPHSWRV